MNAKSTSPNNILYLDTSTEEAEIAVVDTGEEFLTFHERRWQAGRELSKTLSKNVDSLLANYKIGYEDLCGVVVFVGPGSFTGLRIGISFANGLAFALGIPIYETKSKESFALDKPKEVALPFYGSEPKITQPKQK